MRTTIQLEDGLLQAAKEQAAREGKTLKQLFEEGLRLVLGDREESISGEEQRIQLPVSRCTGGVQPGVELSDNRALEDLLAEG